MAKEWNFEDGPTTSLASAIPNNSATTMTVVSAANFPSDGYFAIRIDDEIIWVTDVSGTTWTILRGVEGTTPTGHASGAIVNMPLTAGGVDRMITGFLNGVVQAAYRRLDFIDTDSVTWDISPDDVHLRIKVKATAAGGGGGGGGGSSWEAPFTKPLLANATWVNQQNATAADTPSGLALICNQSNTSGLRCLVFSLPSSTTYTATLRLRPHGPTNPSFGPILRDSSSGKIIRWPFYVYNGGMRHGWDQGTGPTSLGYQDYFGFDLASDQWWFRIQEDPGNGRNIFVSGDGYTWVKTYHYGAGSYLTPDQVGFCIDPAGDRNFAVTLMSLETTSP